MDQEPATLDEVLEEHTRHLLSEVTTEKLSLTRISAYAAAGISFAAILAILGIDDLSVSLHIAVVSLALAIPFFVFLANLHETFIWHGEKSYEEYKKMAHRRAFHVVVAVPYILFVNGFFSLLWHISALAFVITLIASFALLMTDNYISTHLGRAMEELDASVSKNGTSA